MGVNNTKFQSQTDKMPTVSVDREDLFQSLGRSYSKEELDELCFDYGIELDDWVEAGEDGEERATLKIDIPANRYDMLCFEGISRSLNVFLGRASAPKYNVVKPERPMRLTIEPEVAQVRPYAAAAILRGIEFTPRRYKSFIALQDKLHSNICRNRSLVAIGTHDLSKVKGDVRYRGLPAENIKFRPLNQAKEMTGPEIFDHYTNVDKHLARFVPLVSQAPVVPLFVDSEDTVLSMPPLINSDHTKITLETKDVFFDLTATDPTKLEIVLNEIVAMFAGYTSNPFTIEAVEVVYTEGSGADSIPQKSLLPKLDTPFEMDVEISYLNAVLGLDLKGSDYAKLLAKMMLESDVKGDKLQLRIPKTRPDILHQCDIIEDAGIGYGFNSLPRAFPGSAGLIGTHLPINKVADILRHEAAQSGWTEVMPLTLSSVEENFDWLRVKNDGKTAVRLENPKTVEYQVVRTTLIPGILKTLRENRDHSLPIKVFESGDVVFQDLSAERRARNQRNFAAAYAGTSAGFEIPQGLLDRLMKMLRYEFAAEERGYWLEESNFPQYFPGRGANIVLKKEKNDKPKIVGHLGVLHPEVLQKFGLPFVCSCFEIDATVFL